MPTVLSNGVSKTTGTALRVTKFNATHCLHKYLLLRVNRINGSKIALRNISDKNVFFLYNPSLHRGSSTRGERSVRTTSTPSRVKASEGGPSATSLVLNEAESEALLDERLRL